MVKSLKNQRGQMILEAILLMFIFLGVAVGVAKYFESEGIISQLVSKPWKTLSGTIQNGVPEAPTAGGGKHPSTHLRHVSLDGDDAR